MDEPFQVPHSPPGNVVEMRLFEGLHRPVGDSLRRFPMTRQHFEQAPGQILRRSVCSIHGLEPSDETIGIHANANWYDEQLPA